MAMSCTDNMQTNNPEAVIPEILWKKLYKADLTLEVPFQIKLKDQEDVLICEKILRILPKKRLVALCTWGDKQVVAKLFYERGNAKRHVKRELAGIDSLVISGIPTAKLLFQGTAQKNRIQVLIFERIMGGVNLGDLWQEKNSPEEMITIMKAITIELATQHVLGIIQCDLHLNNFLVTKKQIYTLDAGNINHINELLPKEQSLEHLALFFAQLGVGTENLQDILFKTYVEARSWLVKKADIDLLRKATKLHTEKRWERFEKKIHRDSTAFALVKNSTSICMYDRAYQTVDLENFLKHPDAVFQDNNTKIIKAGRSSTVAKIKLGNRYYVVKRYNMKGFFHWLRRCMRTTRAEKSWTVAQRMYLFGIPTAKPVAYIEKNILGLRGKSYFLMEFVNGVDAGEYFSKYKENDPIFETIAQRIIQLFTNLATLHLIHGDLKITNILIEHERPVLIDLDGMTEVSSMFRLKRAFKKEMQRFLRNWDSRPSVKALFERLIN